MPRPANSPEQQFIAVEDLLTRWLRERRELLGKYTEIVVTLDSDPQAEALALRQGALCEVLVDYISAGHFEVFHELLDEAERFADGSGTLARQLIPAIGDTTEVLLAYEEKYGSGATYPDTLKRDLSSLGEVLESRFVLEDRLIAGLHSRHRRLVASETTQGLTTR
ncbi:MAG: Rsd/AlgQ family anti-sigma factor [Pseudomonadales bacterium]|nr:Rsd/AlgQ family anti-sigma factor [Halieaceae bacterium]MCP5189452.1 Rsd/AlgQ family anti-sigma factor [Pseudomonadales bacterium]MCP5205272.1 Rsd/AlgQ family anti-sigma factor [Pseudomonadales bacterium]